VTRILPPAAILAGGLGTRIRSVGGDVPKVLLPVGGRPFLAHVLEWLAGEGVREAVLLLGHKAESILAVAEEHAPEGLRVTGSVEPEPLGTGGALRWALDDLPLRFLLINGDTLVPADLGALLRAHEASETEATLTLVRSHRAAEKGSVALDAEGSVGMVTRFDEKVPQGTGLINAGVYVIQRGVVAGLDKGAAVSLERDVLPGLVSRGRVAGMITDVPFLDIGLPDDYLAVRDGLPDRGGNS